MDNHSEEERVLVVMELVWYNDLKVIIVYKTL